jgi:hypothetical protein
MPNPYAASHRRRVSTTSEGRSELDQFITRLSDLGATDDELTQVREQWDALEPDDTPDDPDLGPAWTRAYRDQLVATGDRELTQLLRRARAEHLEGTTDPDEAEATARRRAYDRALGEAQDRVGGTVAEVLAWVADDPVRAQAVHQLETSSDGANRKTLVEPLADLLDAYVAPHGDERGKGPKTPPAPDTPGRGPHSGSGDQPTGDGGVPRPGEDVGRR